MENKNVDLEHWKFFARSDPNQTASDFSDLMPDRAAEIARALGRETILGVVRQIGTDAAAGLVRNLPENFRRYVINHLPADKKTALKEILSYAPGTAGALMAKEFLAVPMDATMRQATEYLQSIAHWKKGKVSYIYVVDAHNRLEGVIQVRDLIFYPPNKAVSEILKKPVVQVETGMSQIDVARLLERHHYLGLPVVNEAQELVGVISADNALKIFEAEAVDDIAKIVGTGAEEIRTHSILKILHLRLPWLLVNLASGLLCAYLLGFFELKAPQLAILFLFIPVILGISESTGVQGATIVVQNFALGHASAKDLGSLFLREILVGIFIGVVCGAVVGLTAFAWQNDRALGLALASSMGIAILISSVIGLTLPMAFKRFRFDPAMASGPLVLAICDLQTLIVYFNVSGIFLLR